VADVDNRGLIFRSDPDSLGRFRAAGWREMNGAAGWTVASAPAMVFDERGRPDALRGIVAQFRSRVGGGTVCSTDADCLEGEICAEYGERFSLCVSSDQRFARVFEHRSLGIDGIAPGILESIDEWPTLLEQFCSTLRGERGFAPSPWSSEFLLGGTPCVDAPPF
jgi:hypothetical protein